MKRSWLVVATSIGSETESRKLVESKLSDLASQELCLSQYVDWLLNMPNLWRNYLTYFEEVEVAENCKINWTKNAQNFLYFSKEESKFEDHMYLRLKMESSTNYHHVIKIAGRTR